MTTLTTVYKGSRVKNFKIEIFLELIEFLKWPSSFESLHLHSLVGGRAAAQYPDQINVNFSTSNTAELRKFNFKSGKVKILPWSAPPPWAPPAPYFEQLFDDVQPFETFYYKVWDVLVSGWVQGVEHLIWKCL